MSQSVNVLSCVCPNCPDCSGESQYYKEKRGCAACVVPTCKVCTRTSIIKRIVVQSQQAKMLRDNDEILSSHFDLLEYYPHYNHTFLIVYQMLTDQKAKVKPRSFTCRMGCKFIVQDKILKITIEYLIDLSDNGKGLHLKIQSCKSSDLNRKFEVTFDKGQTEIDISLTSPKIMINIDEYHENFNRTIL